MSDMKKLPTEDRAKYTEAQIAFQRQDIKNDADTLAVALRACLGFIRWVESQDDPFQFIKVLASLDEEQRFDVWDDPMAYMIDAILQDPNLLADMQHAYNTVTSQRQNMKVAELSERLNKTAHVSNMQAKMITELRGLVAKTKLKKFDAANKEKRQKTIGTGASADVG